MFVSQMPHRSAHAEKITAYAFIDNENVNVSVQRQGRKIDRAKFRKWLKKEKNVEVAYMFMGYLPDYQEMYTFFQSLGYVLIFKPMSTNPNAPHKGNIDAELVLQAMIDLENYQKAIIVTGDGDFSCLVSYLRAQGKLDSVIVPNQERYSDLLNQAAGGHLDSITSLKKLLEYKRPKQEKKRDTSYYDDFYA